MLVMLFFVVYLHICLRADVNRTFPPANILLYNAITGSGDELYGIEPASYYAKNLLLTVGLSFPLAVAEAVMFVWDLLVCVSYGKTKPCETAKLLTESGICLSAGLWMALLFSRPHKVRY
jgi:alpha-1,2-mannosyltransferase